MEKIRSRNYNKGMIQRYEVYGGNYTVNEIAEMLGLAPCVVRATTLTAHSLKELEEKLTKCVQRRKSKYKRYLYKGKKYTIRELSILSGIRKETLRARLFMMGWSIEEAIEIKPLKVGYYRDPAHKKKKGLITAP